MITQQFNYFVYLPSVQQSLSLIILPSIRPSLCPSVRPSVRPYIKVLSLIILPSIHPSVRPSIRPSIRVLACQSVCHFTLTNYDQKHLTVDLKINLTILLNYYNKRSFHLWHFHILAPGCKGCPELFHHPQIPWTCNNQKPPDLKSHWDYFKTSLVTNLDV